MSGLAYYNEIDPYVARWLRNLIDAGQIASGDVDERSIVDVRPDDLRGYAQCHFFAGIGGWSHALRLAGWRDDRVAWTGSCPCQPLSSAGQRQGHADRRHLWPAFHRLIAECRPAVVFGEQVAGKDGREWLAAVRADLEAAGYAVGAADLPACSVGAPHIRQRLWFVADAEGERQRANRFGQDCRDRKFMAWAGTRRDSGDNGAAGLLADTGSDRSQDGRIGQQQLEAQPAGGQRDATERSRCSPWSDLVWLPCTDGKARPAQPGIFPLSHGVPGRVGRLRAYGNAIVPQVAAEFVRAFADGD